MNVGILYYFNYEHIKHLLSIARFSPIRNKDHLVILSADNHLELCFRKLNTTAPCARVRLGYAILSSFQAFFPQELSSIYGHLKPLDYP
jgi:hypothetical protein